MSILDGLPTSEDQIKTAIEKAAPILEQVVAAMQPTERETSILELMKEGLSLGTILGITKEQREALLVQAGRFLQLGEIQKARDFLFQVYQLEPTDERAIYALATTYQLEGDFAAAGKLYVMFLALDATNPEGHLRLGECFLAAKEYENAEGSFTAGQNFAKSAGDAASAGYAGKMLAVTRDRRRAAAS